MGDIPQASDWRGAALLSCVPVTVILRQLFYFVWVSNLYVGSSHQYADQIAELCGDAARTATNTAHHYIIVVCTW